MSYSQQQSGIINILCALFISVFISACSILPQPYEELSADKLQIKTHSAFMMIDNSPPTNRFLVELKPGQHVFLARYLTLTQDYQCQFSFTGKPGQYYEVVEHFNGEPLTLYRLVRRNWFWYQRVDTVFPDECIKIPTD